MVLLIFKSVGPANHSSHTKQLYSLVMTLDFEPCLSGVQVKTALQAVTQLHGHQLVPPVKKRKGSKPAAEEPSEPLWARQLKGEGALVKKWRVILRNLPFNVSHTFWDFLAQHRLIHQHSRNDLGTANKHSRWHGFCR